MTFELAPADRDALSQVDIRIPGTQDVEVGGAPTERGKETSGIILNQYNLMFPPKVTKDSKAAEWKEWTSGSFEPAKWYVQSKPKQLGLEFEWIVGSYSAGKGELFTPRSLRQTLSGIKSFFYGPFFGGKRRTYPAVFIHALYAIIPRNALSRGNGNGRGKPAAFRIMDVNVTYSDTLAKIDGEWHPLHTKLTMNLEGASQLGGAKPRSGADTEDPPGGAGAMSTFKNLPNRPIFEWF